jgi:hypothetical protein
MLQNPIYDLTPTCPISGPNVAMPFGCKNANGSSNTGTSPPQTQSIGTCFFTPNSGTYFVDYQGNP